MKLILSMLRIKGSHYNMNLRGDIDKYRSLYQTLVFKLCSKKDTIQLNINSYGGNFLAGLNWYAGVSKTKANTISYVEENAQSIAAILALASDKLICKDDAKFMFHKPRYWPSNELLEPEHPANATMDNLIKKYAEKYFTEEQKTRYNKGEDVYLTGKEVKNHEV